MRMAIFGGSFDPVHTEHIEYVLAAREALALGRVVVMPSYIAPHKQGGASADGKNRLEMCKIAFGSYDFVEVSDYELTAQSTSYTYLTARHFAKQYPDAARYFLVGADMLENFFCWKNPEDILAHVTLAACGRGGAIPHELHERFIARFGCDFVEVPFTGDSVSSTEIRVDLAFGKRPKGLTADVYNYIVRHDLYAYLAITRALLLEKEGRREHSYRVAKMACARARSLGIPEREAMLAAGLHDCGKYVPLSSPMLAGFVPPEGVPEPVLHQFTGAYLAEHVLGICERSILGAIRYHTSGRAEMTVLEQLIYLADMLEEGRDFPGVEPLRKLFWEDLGACLYASLEHQMRYLAESGKPVYSLTAEAYKWAQKWR